MNVGFYKPKMLVPWEFIKTDVDCTSQTFSKPARTKKKFETDDISARQHHAVSALEFQNFRGWRCQWALVGCRQTRIPQQPLNCFDSFFLVLCSFWTLVQHFLQNSFDRLQQRPFFWLLFQNFWSWRYQQVLVGRRRSRILLHLGAVAAVVYFRPASPGLEKK